MAFPRITFLRVLQVDKRTEKSLQDSSKVSDVR
jgi:hypothetical protein